jgi:hypothetical protein
MERKATLLEAAVIGGAVLLSTSPEATPLRAADSTPSENPYTLVTPLPETYGKLPDINTAVNSPEFQTSQENPGFILLNTYDQNDATAQDRLVSDLAVQKTWIMSHGVPAEVFEQGIINMPLSSEGTNFIVPVNRLVVEFNGAKPGSLLIPYSETNGESKLAIYADPDGQGDDTKIDVLGLIPNANSTLTEPKALPTLFKKGTDGKYVAISIFEVPSDTDSTLPDVPTVTGTPVYQAEVATDSLNLRDPLNPATVMSQIGRNENIMLISDRKITVPGKNYVLREALVDGNIALVAENLLTIKPQLGSAEYNSPMNLYAEIIQSAESFTSREGITVKSVDIVAQQVLPDVPVRPIVFIQSNEMQNQPDKFRTGTMKINNVPELVPLTTDNNPKRPNFVLDGKETALNADQAIEVSVSQSLLKIALANKLVPEGTTIENFIRNYSQIEIPITGKGGNEFTVKANAPVIFRVRGFESTIPQKGLVKSNFGSFERTLGPNGELVIDMYYSSDKATTKGMNFAHEDNWETDERNTVQMLNNAIFSLGEKSSYASFESMFGQYFYGKYPIRGGPDLTEIYDPNIHVYLDFALNWWGHMEMMDLYKNQYQLFSFN